MDSRQQQAIHASSTFSIVAHEALDYIVADGEYDEYLNDHVRHRSYQQKRRRLGVSNRFS